MTRKSSCSSRSPTPLPEAVELLAGFGCIYADPIFRDQKIQEEVDHVILSVSIAIGIRKKSIIINYNHYPVTSLIFICELKFEVQAWVYFVPKLLP